MKKLLIACVALLWWFLLFSNTSTSVNASGVLKPNNGFVDAVWWPTKAVKDVNVIGDSQGQQDALVNVIKWWVNWVLWILALIALVFLMYGGFLMVISWWNEEQYKKWFTILRHWAIGLALIGVAWFVVSLVFWLINLAWDATVNQSAWTGS